MHAIVFIRNIHMHKYVITNLLMLFFWIKLIMKLPKFLTYPCWLLFILAIASC